MDVLLYKIICNIQVILLNGMQLILLYLMIVFLIKTIFNTFSYSSFNRNVANIILKCKLLSILSNYFMKNNICLKNCFSNDMKLSRDNKNDLEQCTTKFIITCYLFKRFTYLLWRKHHLLFHFNLAHLQK